MKSIIRTSILVDDAIATPFPLIQNLYLSCLPELEEICDGPISSCSFQNLYSIEIFSCHSLRNLGQLSMAGNDCLPHLQQLIIQRCEMMEQVFLWTDKEAAGQNKTSIESQPTCHVITTVFPKLKGVWLGFMLNLTTFYQGIEGIDFPLLTGIGISRCPKMKSIISGSNEKSNSGEITSSSADIDDDDTLHLFCQPQKVSFGSSLDELDMNHNPFCRHEIPSSLFNGLKDIKINKYEGSMSLFTLSMARNLVSLRKLCIANCDEMIKVIEDEQQQQSILLFPKLEELRLWRLPKLVRFCEWKCDVQLPSLTSVDIEECPNMKISAWEWYRRRKN